VSKPMSATSKKASKECGESSPKRRSSRRMSVSRQARKAQRPLGRTSRSASRRPGEVEAEVGTATSDTSAAVGVGDEELETTVQGVDGELDDELDLDRDPLRARNLVDELDEVAEPEVSGGDDAELDDVRREQARNENAPREAANFLAMYFREMAALDVLQPEEEFQAAREIEALEIDVWRALLSCAPAADCVLRTVEAVMDNSLPEFRGLRRAATEARRDGSDAARRKLERAAARLAGKLRALDTDRVILDAVLAELERIERGSAGRIVADKHLPEMDGGELTAYSTQVREAVRAAEAARNAFVKANLRLVVSIARRFNHGRMALADLIQEGNIGLMKAVERYDYRRGFRFSTYASWWIRHAISRALADKGREVRLPVHMIDAYHRLSKAKRELTAKLGRQPHADELAEATGLPTSKIEKMRTYLVDQSFSLDRPVNDEDGRHFVEFLQDPTSSDSSPAERLGTEAITNEVRDLLAHLKPIEADILRQRFGLDDDQELTLKEIGEKYNLSRERIRQLQEQALAKMRRALARKDML
jgi:RNA polymerase primary sigma factor